MFKPIQELAATIGQPEPAIDEAGVAKRVFAVLHGYYGNLFLNKFSTGKVADSGPNKGQDMGIVSSMRVWGHSLRPYDADTVMTALNRCQANHPEFPPSLPQFVALCEACKPRKVWRAPEAPLSIGMSDELRRELIEKHRQRARELIEAVKAADADGLSPLKRAIADAVAAAGGDEVATLLRLDRQLAPRAAA